MSNSSELIHNLQRMTRQRLWNIDTLYCQKYWVTPSNEYFSNFQKYKS